MAFVIWWPMYSFRKSSLIEAVYGITLIARSESIFFVFFFKITFQQAFKFWRKLLLFRSR